MSRLYGRVQSAHLRIRLFDKRAQRIRYIPDSLQQGQKKSQEVAPVTALRLKQK